MHTWPSFYLIFYHKGKASCIVNYSRGRFCNVTKRQASKLVEEFVYVN